MSVTLAIFSQNGVWYVGVENTGVSWEFTSASATRIFARGMKGGAEELAKWIGGGDILRLSGGSSAPSPSTIVQELFKPTNRLTYGTEDVFASMEGRTLLEDIVTAGETLLEFTPMAHPPSPKAQRKKAAASDVEKKPKVAVDTPDFSITWNNFCPDAFSLDLWGWPSDDPMCRAISLPTSTLDATGGTEVLAWEQNLIDVGEDAGSGYAVWKHPNGHWFGVDIWIPGEVAHIGTAPYYQVCWSQVGHSDWFNPVSDPGQAYKFPSNWEALCGFNVRIDPDAGGTTLLLKVMISTP